jgi:stress response protein SCP2
MQEITKGANASLEKMSFNLKVVAGNADISAYILTSEDKVSSDEDMIFYNQPKNSNGSVILSGADFTFDLANLPAKVEKIAICAVMEAGNVSALGSVSFVIPDEISFKTETTGMTEAAIIVAEIYRRNGAWKIRAVAQGFNGGLAPLSKHFGVEVEEEVTATPSPLTPIPAAPPPQKVDLVKKRLVSLEKKDPQLVSLAKKASVSLEKKSLSNETAKVILALDISGSMSGRYRNGSVDRLVQRVLGLGLNMDDDGTIEVYAFGSGAYRIGVADIDNYKNFVSDMLRKRSLEGSTHYGKVIEMIRKDMWPNENKTPVYVMFVTDGDTQDRSLTEKQVREASKEGIFWQFMGINDSSYSGGFNFLEKLDDLSGRYVDNCDFFSVRSSDDLSDEKLYDKMMGEYPGWLKTARNKGIF